MTRAVGEAGRPAPSEAYVNQVAMGWAERSACKSGGDGEGYEGPTDQSGQMPAITQLSPPANASPCTRDWRLSVRDG